jgi:hypothetical protein
VDKSRATIVNNESAEILRMLEVEFRAFANPKIDLYPEALRAEIDGSTPSSARATTAAFIRPASRRPRRLTMPR